MFGFLGARTLSTASPATMRMCGVGTGWNQATENRASRPMACQIRRNPPGLPRVPRLGRAPESTLLEVHSVIDARNFRACHQFSAHARYSLVTCKPDRESDEEEDLEPTAEETLTNAMSSIKGSLARHSVRLRATCNKERRRMARRRTYGR
jgi:hypothetical protein